MITKAKRNALKEQKERIFELMQKNIEQCKELYPAYHEISSKYIKKPTNIQIANIIYEVFDIPKEQTLEILEWGDKYFNGEEAYFSMELDGKKVYLLGKGQVDPNITTQRM